MFQQPNTLLNQNNLQVNVQIAVQEAQQLQLQNELLKQAENTISADLQTLNQKLEQNKTSLRSSIFQKIGQDKAIPNNSQVQGEFSQYPIYVIQNVIQFEKSMEAQLEQVRQKNKQIGIELVKTHKGLEKFAVVRRKLNKNSAKELGLVQDVQDLRMKCDELYSRLEDHQTKISFNDEYRDLSKNKEIQEFNDQSIDLLKDLKRDYINSKITLDKCQHTLKFMLENMNETKSQSQAK